MRHVCRYSLRPEEGFGSPELDLPVIVSPLVWVLGAEESSRHASSALNCWAIASAQFSDILMMVENPEQKQSIGLLSQVLQLEIQPVSQFN